MPEKLDILRLFSHEEWLTPSHLANLLDIKQNYARQIILRLKRQGLIFLYPGFAGAQAYSLTSKGEARIAYLADKEKRRLKSEVTAVAEKEGEEAIAKQSAEAIQKKLRPMSLNQVVSHGLPKEIEARICREFDIASVWQLANKKLSEIALPQKMWEETGFSKLNGERMLAYRQLPFDVWIRVLENISKPSLKPQHLSFEEVFILSSLVQQRRIGKFLVTKDGEIFYDGGKGYLSMGAATLVAANRRERRRRGWS